MTAKKTLASIALGSTRAVQAAKGDRETSAAIVSKRLNVIAFTKEIEKLDAANAAMAAKNATP